MPKPSYFHQAIYDLGIGTYEDICTATYETPIIEALNKFVGKRVSALPIVDNEGKLLDIYAKFDVIVSIEFRHVFVTHDFFNNFHLDNNLFVYISSILFTESGCRKDI